MLVCVFTCNCTKSRLLRYFFFSMFCLFAFGWFRCWKKTWPQLLDLWLCVFVDISIVTDHSIPCNYVYTANVHMQQCVHNTHSLITFVDRNSIRIKISTFALKPRCQRIIDSGSIWQWTVTLLIFNGARRSVYSNEILLEKLFIIEQSGFAARQQTVPSGTPV